MENQNLQLKNIRDKALLAKDVYNDTNEGKLPDGWHSISELKDNSSGYFGRAYINNNTHEIVIAHRGTQGEMSIEGVKDLATDAVLALGKEPEQLKQAEKFTQEVMTQIDGNNKYEGYSFSHTGHSLGGYLADVVSAKEGQPSFSIDAPGSKAFMQEHLNANEFLRAEKNHIAIIGSGDLVSNTSIGSIDVNTKDHIGQVFVLENLKATTGDIINPIHIGDYHDKDWYLNAIDEEFQKNPNNKLTDIENVFKLPTSRYDYRTNIDIGDDKGLIWNFQEKLVEIASGLGIEAETLNSLGFEPDKLIAAGYSATDLIEVGYSSKEFNAAGLSPNQLLNYGLNVEDLKTVGYSADNLVKSGLTLSELVEGGFKSQDFENAGLSPDVLINEGLSLEQIKSVGYTANDFDRSGIDPQDLIDKGYDVSTLKDIGYTVGDLANANVDLDELKEVYSNDELRQEFTKEELAPKQELLPQPEPQVEPGPSSQPVFEPEPEPKSQTEPDPSSQPVIEPEGQDDDPSSQPVIEPEPEPEGQDDDPSSQPVIEPKPEPEGQYDEPLSQPVIEPEPEPEGQYDDPLSQPVIEPEPEPEGQDDEPLSQPVIEPEPEPEGQYDDPLSQPVIEPVPETRTEPIDYGGIDSGEGAINIDNGVDDALNAYIKDQIERGNELLSIRTNNLENYQNEPTDNVDNGIYPDYVDHAQSPAASHPTDNYLDALNQQYERTQREIQNLIKDDGYRPIDPSQYESHIKAPDHIDLDLDDDRNINNNSGSGSEDVHTQI